MLLVYSKQKNGIVNELRQHLRNRSNQPRLTCYSSIDDLKRRLHQPRLSLKISVLVVGSAPELDRLVALKELFADLRLILVLPDHDSQTLTKAHMLAPRFVAFRDEEVISLVSVIERMLGSHVEHPNPIPETVHPMAEGVG